MDQKAVWEAGLRQIEARLNKQVFDTWFRPTQIEALNDNSLTLSVPSRFVGDWLREHYSGLITDEVQSITQQKDLHVRFVIREEEAAPELEADPPKNPSADKERVEKRRAQTKLNPKYTFDTFVVGDSNQFSHAASRAVAELPGRRYNPLFIYGGVGLGKTHLLSAVGNHLIERNSGTQIVYLSAEQFTNEVINSIRYNRMVEFRDKYRNNDVLLIDDIQFIEGKERTQEEFFHTFNTLYEAQKQIVLTSDRFPNEMPTVEERLRSRFCWGLIADIQPPDLETKIAILRKKADAENIDLADEVCLLLATGVNTNIRELEGCLLRLEAYSSFTGQAITPDVARFVLRDTIANPKKVVTVENVQEVVAERFHTKMGDLKSKKRTRVLVVPRQIAMYLCRELTDLSYPEIGRQFGGKDHTTVIYAYKQIEKNKLADPGLNTLLDELIHKIRG